MLIESFLCEENLKFICITYDKNIYRKVDAKLFQKKLHLPKSFSDLAEVDHWFIDLEKKLVKNLVLRLLSIKNYPSEIIKQKLLERGVSEATILQVISFFVEQGYINDKEWLEYFIQQEIRKGNGKKMIFFKLQRKKIHFSYYKELLDEVFPEEKEKEKILEYVKKNTHKSKGSQISALLRKGFSSEHVFEMIRPF